MDTMDRQTETKKEQATALFHQEANVIYFWLLLNLCFCGLTVLENLLDPHGRTSDDWCCMILQARRPSRDTNTVKALNK